MPASCWRSRATHSVLPQVRPEPSRGLPHRQAGRRRASHAAYASSSAGPPVSGSETTGRIWPPGKASHSRGLSAAGLPSIGPIAPSSLPPEPHQPFPSRSSPAQIRPEGAGRRKAPVASQDTSTLRTGAYRSILARTGRTLTPTNLHTGLMTAVNTIAFCAHRARSGRSGRLAGWGPYELGGGQVKADTRLMSSKRGPAKRRGSPASAGGRQPSAVMEHKEPGSAWWKNPTIVVPTIVALVGILIGAYFSLHPRAPAVINPSAICKQRHPHADGTGKPSLVPGAGGISRYSGCLWPVITGADSSGYWTVAMKDYQIPDAAAAQKYTDIEVFTTGCQALMLDYQFDNQLTVAHVRFTVETSQTVSGYDGKSANLLDDGGYDPTAIERAQGTHLIVLTNLRYRLYRVTCTSIS